MRRRTSSKLSSDRIIRKSRDLKIVLKKVERALAQAEASARAAKRSRPLTTARVIRRSRDLVILLRDARRALKKALRLAESAARKSGRA